MTRRGEEMMAMIPGKDWHDIMTPPMRNNMCVCDISCGRGGIFVANPSQPLEEENNFDFFFLGG